ncbi:MAG: hypothetical protein AB8C02_09125 [Halioglobus sp.]
MNNVRNWLLGTAAIVIATSFLLAAFNPPGDTAGSQDPAIDSMKAPY